MLRTLLYAKIHRASVTQRDLNYVGSISIDRDLLEATGLLPNEKVDIYNITNGERFSTYVLEAESGSGMIGLNGAAAHKVELGDKIIIVSYCQLAELEIPHHHPRIVVIDSDDNLNWKLKD